MLYFTTLYWVTKMHYAVYSFLTSLVVETLMFTCAQNVHVIHCIPQHSVISGVGELDIISHGSNISPPSTPVHEPASYPYLLLDVRCKEDYDQCHIISGKF